MRLYRDLRRRLHPDRRLRAAAIGLIVGLGMALFAPFVGQSPLLLGLIAGPCAALLMLFQN